MGVCSSGKLCVSLSIYKAVVGLCSCVSMTSHICVNMSLCTAVCPHVELCPCTVVCVRVMLCAAMCTCAALHVRLGVCAHVHSWVCNCMSTCCSRTVWLARCRLHPRPPGLALCLRPDVFGVAALVGGLGLLCSPLTSAPRCCQPLCSRDPAHRSPTPGSSCAEIAGEGETAGSEDSISVSEALSDSSAPLSCCHLTSH